MKAGASSYTHIDDGMPGSELSYTDTSVSANTNYIYHVTALGNVGDKTYKSVSSEDVERRFLSRPVISSVANSTTAGKLIVKWTALSGITGCKLLYSTTSSFTSSTTKTITISSASTASKSLTGLTSGKKYYVKMRAYYTQDGKTWYFACTLPGMQPQSKDAGE